MTDSQDLCTHCGLCCTGALHNRAPLQEHEVKPLLKLVSNCVIRIQGQPKLHLPCKAYKEGGCSIYNERPGRCRSYQCKLLKKFMGGEVPFAEALALVEQAKADLDNREFLFEHFDDSQSD